MAEGIRQNITAMSAVVNLYIEGKVIPTEFLVLPEAKGNKTLLGRDFLNAAGIVLDVQGGKWYFFENPRKQCEFFKKPLEEIAISAFELREDEVTYEIADPANPDQVLGTYHISALKDYHESGVERDTGPVAPLRKRGRPKKLPPGSELRRQQNQRGSLYLRFVLEGLLDSYRYIVFAHPDIIAKHYSLCKFYSTSVQNMSIEIQIFSERELSVFPPHKVRGMKVLDRDAFRKEVSVPFLLVTFDIFGEVVELLKQRDCLLDIDNLQPVQDIGKDKIILLNPDLSEEKLLFLSQCIHTFDVSNVSWRRITVTYENWNAQEILKAILPINTNNKTTIYSITGHIIHVCIKPELKDFKYVIGQVLLDKHPNIRTVIYKVPIIEDKFHNLSFELLAGVPEYEILVKEKNFQYAFDFSKVLWNPPLVKEREQIFKKIESGDLVYDVFADVGKYAIPLAGRKCHVHANDINPDSYKWLCHNVNLNKVTQYIHTYNLDEKGFIQTIVKNGLIDFWSRENNNSRVHVLLNLPSCAIDFLETFKGLFSENLLKVGVMPIINCYFYPKKGETYKYTIDKYFDDEAKKSLKISVIRLVKAKSVLFRATYKLTKKTLFLDFGEPPAKKLKCGDEN
ncbi:hypothetical protein NPIL_421781 [Nephila pilipes]|uniref:tRNA (guanine(37)-N1)-methyltransferase n=1 Tax=Nephila pilipes TaxID=299642 RepID=A0A8X6NXF5_NEPPI|nr:hypothetical protein NPIL_421781 [Nephila pilipes]